VSELKESKGAESKVAYDELLGLCKTVVPMLKRIPRAAASQFARTWAQLLWEATKSGSLSAWAAFFMFPKAVLFAPPRGGKRFSKKRSMADLLLDRISKWSELWNEVKLRAVVVEVKSSKFVDPSAESLLIVKR
jgi:hypothetical protein